MSSSLPSKSPLTGKPAPIRPKFQRFLTRAETVTLVGMLMVVFSLYLPWEHVPIIKSFPGAALYAASVDMTRSGLNTMARWPLTICAIACGALLLWAPTEKNRFSLAVVQGVCGGACLITALSRFSLLPGLLLTLIGGVLLILGAIDRFSAPAAQAGPENTA